MKKDKILFSSAGSYQTPVVNIMTICTEGLLCMSLQVEVEDYDNVIELF